MIAKDFGVFLVLFSFFFFAVQNRISKQVLTFTPVFSQIINNNE